MKRKMKSIGWILMLGIGSITMVQSCQKDPCEPCKNVPCDKFGFVAEEPFGCIVPPEKVARKGIRGDDGIFYVIREDLTGNFKNYDLGSYVQFGLCAVKPLEEDNLSIGECGTGIMAVEKREATLGCIKIGHTVFDPSKCNQEAEVVGVSTTVNTPPIGGRYLKIEGKVYTANGTYADQIQKMAFGTRVTGSFPVNADCYLTMVITYPPIVGCVDVNCLKDMP